MIHLASTHLLSLCFIQTILTIERPHNMFFCFFYAKLDGPQQSAINGKNF